MTLKTIIENFLAHVEELETKLKEGEDLYEKEFQNLKILTDQVRATAQYSCSTGELAENRRKNRYKDILPYDINRVVLHDDPDVPGSDYINASYIKGASGSIAYIASQAPLPNTVNDFWRMIWESEVQTIVMVCNEIEAGRAKCEHYWSNENEVKQYGRIFVKLVEQQNVGVDYKVRELSITYGDMTRKINQFHYHTWPDHGVPLSVKAMIEMVSLVRRFQGSETVPLLVHCSAGCGRTGTVCAIDYVCGLLRIGKLTEEFSIKQLVFEMRKQRIAMVQTSEQYMVVHRAVRELFEEHLKVIDSHPYANIDFTGHPYLHKIEGDYVNIEPRGAAVVASGNTIYITVSKEDPTNLSDSKVPPLPRKTKVEHHNNAECDHLSKNGIDCLETNTEKISNRSRMDYVKDWCDGILTSKCDVSEGSQQGPPDESLLQQQPRPTRLKTPTQSPFQSPNLKRRSTCEVVNDKQQQHLGKSNFTNLVRKPSMAKFRALFDSASNSGSSGNSSPENWRSRSSPRLSTLASSKSTDDGGVVSEKSGSPVLRKPVRSKSKAKEHDLLKDELCNKVLARYDDTAYRIFKENRHLHSDYLECENVGLTPSPSSRSGNGCDNRDDFSLSDSPSPKIYRHRSYLSISHSPLPTSSSESVVKDLVTRVVGSRRNSYAEKRSSTWYDDAASLEADKKSDSPKGSGYKHLNTSHLSSHAGSNRKIKNGTGSSVKRSISMKVGFRSPLFSRKKAVNDDVAAYLAVEEAKKNEHSTKYQSKPKIVTDSCQKKMDEVVVSSTCSDDVIDRDIIRKAVPKDKPSCKTVPVPSPRLSRIHAKDNSSNNVSEKKNRQQECFKTLEPHVGGSEIRDIDRKNSDGQHTAIYANQIVGAGERSIPGNEMTSKSSNVEESHATQHEVGPKCVSVQHGNAADDLYGAEMDEYCQKIIWDCQKYLVSRQSVYLPSEVKEDEESNVSDSNVKRIVSKLDDQKSDHDYERLWLSRSVPKDGKVPAMAVGDRIGHSVVKDGSSEFYVDDKTDQMYVNHPFKVDVPHQHFIRKPRHADSRSAEEFLKLDLDELRYTIEQLGTESADRCHRKPLPAPRTVLSSTKANTADNHDVMNRSPVRRRGSDDVSSQNYSSSTSGEFPKTEPMTLVNTSHLERKNTHEYENAVLISDFRRLDDEDNCPSMEDGSEREIVMNRISDNLPLDIDDHSSAVPLYRSIRKCRSRDSDPQNKVDCDEESVVVRVRSQGHDGHSSRCMTKSVGSVKPVAPPRLRRKPSVSSSKNSEAPNESRPISLEIEKRFYFDPCDQPHRSLPEPFGEPDYTEGVDEIPPVPVKTKDAYRLPQDESSSSDLANIESQSTSSGLYLTKALNKLQTNILAKFAHNADEKESTSSSSVGVHPRRSSQRCLTVPGFPDRLDVKPKGPREPPPHFKVSSCTL